MIKMNDKEKVVRRLLDDKCKECGENLAEDYHTCPYEEDINKDDKFLCNCCKGCQEQCVQEI